MGAWEGVRGLAASARDPAICVVAAPAPNGKGRLMSIVQRGAGESVTPFGFRPDYRSEFVVDASTSDGRVTAAIERVPPGMPHGRHFHRRRDELFLVLEGEIEFSLGDQRDRAGAHTTVFVPRGMTHSFANPYGVTAVMLALWVPGGIEGMYRDWAEAFPAGAPYDHERFVEIWRRHDTEPVEAFPEDA